MQIDGTTPNYALRQSLTVTTGAGSINVGRSNAGSMYTFTANVANFTITAVAPLVALYSPNAYAAITRCRNNNDGTWSVQVWTDVAANVSVYIFDRSSAAAPSGPGYGLQVFSESGELVFDARQRIARILDNQSGNIMGAGPGWGQWNQVDTRTYAFGPYAGVSKVGVAAIGAAFVASPTGGTNHGWYNISGLQTSGNAVNFLYQYYQNGTPSHPGNNTCFGSQYDWRFMAIDLSNI
ncbi:hypothetical protein EYW47_05945 [Paraburkholderia silviterrae]|uniref:Uncharacterized protein n=1 Tax=Paraburkholderia silviterrae TaxID=2528715 RepID=A0A4R5MF16_9BURK|nr:hypothetical protein EYW47_05945 [Paraburkholderia silviterrae]